MRDWWAEKPAVAAADTPHVVTLACEGLTNRLSPAKMSFYIDLAAGKVDVGLPSGLHRQGTLTVEEGLPGTGEVKTDPQSAYTIDRASGQTIYYPEGNNYPYERVFLCKETHPLGGDTAPRAQKRLKYNPSTGKIE